MKSSISSEASSAMRSNSSIVISRDPSRLRIVPGVLPAVAIGSLLAGPRPSDRDDPDRRTAHRVDAEPQLTANCRDAHPPRLGEEGEGFVEAAAVVPCGAGLLKADPVLEPVGLALRLVPFEAIVAFQS